ncbi:hypothetical protein SASPL_143093 [Salvia splendens]|uniref:Uncharacterized protein n=2 Tax=Salvia splendens TaxID=180675 RepID=A0A8X8WM22_SALSN|nr:hypothetical protein SASPL_143093 [Salvia splendens]
MQSYKRVHVHYIGNIYKYAMATDMSRNDAASLKKPCEEGGSSWDNFKNQMKDHTRSFKLAFHSVKNKISIPAKWSVDQNPSHESMELPWERDFTSVC